MVIALVVVFVGMSLAAPWFLTVLNFQTLLLRFSMEGIFAAGMTFALIGGMFDLSMGSVAAFSSILCMSLQRFGVVPACLAAIAAGCLIGSFNGYLVTKWRISALIATIATMTGVTGLSLAYTGNRPVNGHVPSFTKLANGQLGAIPYVTFMFVAVLLLAHLVLTRTQFGRNLFAVGGNQEAARLSGINVNRHHFWTFFITGLTGGCGGVIMASRLNAGSAIMGRDIALNAITAAVIGGVALAGAEGSMLGVLLGSITLAMLSNGMVLLHIPTNYQLTVKGLVLILVVGIDAYMAARRKRRLRTPSAG
jgi:ribose transport system permease protein